MEKFNLTILNIFTTFLEQCRLGFLNDDKYWPLLEELKKCVDKNGIKKNALKSLYEGDQAFFKKMSLSECSQARFVGLLAVLMGDDLHEGIIWDCFTDPYYPNRCLPIDFLNSENRHKLFNELFKRLIGDPRQIVREKALYRIRRDFSDIFTYRIENFSHEEQYRLLMLINPHNAADKNILEDYLNNEDQDLSSRSAYNLQNAQDKSVGPGSETIDKLHLLRYTSLNSYCHRGHPLFTDAFLLLTPHAPLGIQNSFITELSSAPYRDGFIPCYRHGLSLIKRRKDVRTATLLESYIKNKELFSHLKEEILKAFTIKNQYATSPVLKKLITSAKNSEEKKDYLKASTRFTFPLGLNR